MSQIGFPFPIPRIVSILEEAEQEQANLRFSQCKTLLRMTRVSDVQIRIQLLVRSSTPKGFMVWQQISINRINSKCYGLFVPSKILILWQVRQDTFLSWSPSPLNVRMCTKVFNVNRRRVGGKESAASGSGVDFDIVSVQTGSRSTRSTQSALSNWTVSGVCLEISLRPSLQIILFCFIAGGCYFCFFFSLQRIRKESRQRQFRK